MLVAARIEHASDECDVLGRHVRKRCLVDSSALELGEHLVDLSEDGGLAVVLEIEGVERLLPSPCAHDSVDVHGHRIMDEVRAGPRPPGIVPATAATAQAAVAFVSFGLPARAGRARRFGRRSP